MKKNEYSLRELWDIVKLTNTHIIWVPGEEKEAESFFEEKMAENFPNLGKETDTQIQEVYSVLNKMNLSWDIL